MKTRFILAMGICAVLAGSAIAAPVPPPERLRVGAVRELGSNDLLFERPVVLANGQFLGWVTNVDYVGTIASQVKVSLYATHRSVWIFREHLKFDPIKKVVLADEPEDKIQKVSYFD